MSEKDVIKDTKPRMDTVIEDFRRKLGTIRTGRAAVSLLDSVMVDYYGTMTPLNQLASVHALGEMGIEAIAPLLELMSSGKRDTRMHAQRALEMIVARRFGFRPGRGFPDVNAESAARRVWVDNGGYEFSANAGDRNASIVLWRRWLANVRSERP